MALRLIAGTTNAAKAERLRALCAGVDVDWVSAASTAEAPDVDETGDSHIANAVRKAVAWSRAYAVAALASDGGLAIPALGEGWQSLLTGRATGGNVSDEEHAARLLRRMQGLQGTRREAYWTEAVAVARNGALIQAWEAVGLRGLIAEDYRPLPAGPGGFWARGLWTTHDGRRHWELSPAGLAEVDDPWSQLAGPVRGLLEALNHERASP